jgi:hypothetical protein
MMLGRNYHSGYAGSPEKLEPTRFDLVYLANHRGAIVVRNFLTGPIVDDLETAIARDLSAGY